MVFTKREIQYHVGSHLGGLRLTKKRDEDFSGWGSYKKVYVVGIGWVLEWSEKKRSLWKYFF